MTSSWGKSWGYSWGKSWGQVRVLVVGGVTTGRPFILPQYAPPFTGRPRKKRQADVLFLGV